MSPLLAEFLGTAILIVLGDGVVANVVLQRTKGNDSGWIVITTGWALAVAIAVDCVGRGRGGALRPAARRQRQRRAPQPRGHDWARDDRELPMGERAGLHRSADRRWHPWRDHR